ncbi:2'-5' RNA ligase family protein [Streptomyces sp. H10-C2]|uniref:2'-5' RNA ligase family protein n=1 Tax=unclassified Streptomyces TaxID=2593676 RepID=UPI0024BA03F6|nr:MULTISPECIES: 2'-5' RNA ligase family protein [unclassified Streptomyces]MDJ0345223.1 2'-5' RNA ligase family protein [Streptomyces sp. PH10-H1]MDJ0368831.1 2'-5' RNA ligase family protein [Streptomyces sp. H10-C2]
MTTPEIMRNHWWWRPGWEPGRRFYTWHLTFKGQDDVHRLAAAYRAGLAGVDGLTLIPDEWLHLTMQGINFVGEVDEQVVQQVVEAARVRLAAVPAFDVTIGPAILDPEAILLNVATDGPVRAVRDAIRAGIGDVLGEVPEKAGGFTPHVSVAYSAGDGPAAPIAAALDGLHVQPATARITSAELIVLHRDNYMYEWESFARVPLG